METTVAARFPLASITAVLRRTGVLHRLMLTGMPALNPLPVTVTSDPGVVWSGLTVTDGLDGAVPVGHSAAADVVEVVDPPDPVVVVVDPPPVVVVVAWVVVVLAGVPKFTSW